MPMLMILKQICSSICGNLALLSISDNFWAALEVVIPTGISSIEFFRCTVLGFLSLVIYSFSLGCSRYNASSSSNSTDTKATPSYLSCLPAVLLFLLKYKVVVVSRIPYVFHFFRSLIGSICPTRVYSVTSLLSFYV